MRQYLDLLQDILNNGEVRVDRTGTGTIGVFGRQLRFDLRKGFPLLTTKKMMTRSIVHELIWILRGDTNIKYLVDNNVSIWTDWPYKHYLKANDISESEYSIKNFESDIRTYPNFASEWGDCGPIYGEQWRAWTNPANGESIDQITNLIFDLKTNPFSRRHIVSAWNVADIPEMAISGLPPCHCLFQFFVSNNMELSCHMYQRSADVFLGVPFNIASYALLTHMIAQVCGLKVGEFIHTFGDVHIYSNHVEQVKTQIAREPLELCKVALSPDVKEIDKFEADDISFVGYKHEPAIPAPVSR